MSPGLHGQRYPLPRRGRNDHRPGGTGTLATLGRDGEFRTYPLLRGALDVEEWLEAWLRQDEPPSAHLPRMDEITALVRGEGRIDTERLEELLIERA